MQSHSVLLAVAAGALLTAPALAQYVDPYAKPDDSWISISGTVVAPDEDSFSLDYGDGVILVEMDDWDTYGDAYGLMDGDRVTVYGEIDDDLFEATSIEAGSVYVENLNTYFYASSADEENGDYTPHFWTVTTPLELNRATVRGTITGIDRPEREFTIDTGDQKMTVETEFLGYNPLDDLGYQKLEKGDRVSVSGALDNDFLEGRVFEADSVITLSDASREEG